MTYRDCPVCHRHRWVAEHHRACDTCIDAALTAAFGEARTTRRSLDVGSLPSGHSSSVRPVARVRGRPVGAPAGPNEAANSGDR